VGSCLRARPGSWSHARTPEDGGAAVPPARSETGPKVRAHAWACASGEHPVSRCASVAAVPSRASLPTTCYGTIAGRCPRDSRRVARRIPLWTRLIYLFAGAPEGLYEFSSVSDPRIAPHGAPSRSSRGGSTGRRTAMRARSEPHTICQAGHTRGPGGFAEKGCAGKRLRCVPGGADPSRSGALHGAQEVSDPPG
jgi:hypothetical protein